jgi:hypothetical protein
LFLSNQEAGGQKQEAGLNVSCFLLPAYFSESRGVTTQRVKRRGLYNAKNSKGKSKIESVKLIK